MQKQTMPSGVAPGTIRVVISFLFVLFCVWPPNIQGQPIQQGQTADTLHQLNSSIEGIVKRVGPSVVQVIVTGFGAVGEGNDSEASLVRWETPRLCRGGSESLTAPAVHCTLIYRAAGRRMR